MSVISTLAQLFQRSAVPSVESTLGQGGSRERAIANLRNLLGEGTTVSNQTIVAALSRIQTALQRGAAIERGETVSRQLIPIDPTIPIGTEFRYRVRVVVDIPDPLTPGGVQTIDTVIPIDSDTDLTRQQINERVQPALSLLGRESASPKFRVFGQVVATQEILRQEITVVSVYRSPIG